MNTTNQTAQVETTTTAKYKLQREARTRYSFNGNGWLNKVLAGNVDDHAKLVAHGVKLKVARSRSDVRKLKTETLLARVQAALQA